MDENVNKTFGFIRFSRGHRKDMERPWIKMLTKPNVFFEDFLEATERIGGWEKRRERSGSPQPGIQAQRPRTRTARTTRQINGARFDWWLARFWNFVFRSASGPRPASHGVSTMLSCTKRYVLQGFAEVKDR